MADTQSTTQLSKSVHVERQSEVVNVESHCGAPKPIAVVTRPRYEIAAIQPLPAPVVAKPKPKAIPFRPPRKLTVGHIRGAERIRIDPEIRFGGHWLAQMGFPVGCQVTLQVSQGRLVIEAISEEDMLRTSALQHLTIAHKMLMVADRPALDPR